MGVLQHRQTHDPPLCGERNAVRREPPGISGARKLDGGRHRDHPLRRDQRHAGLAAVDQAPGSDRAIPCAGGRDHPWPRSNIAPSPRAAECADEAFAETSAPGVPGAPRRAFARKRARHARGALGDTAVSSYSAQLFSAAAFAPGGRRSIGDRHSKPRRARSTSPVVLVTWRRVFGGALKRSAPAALLNIQRSVPSSAKDYDCWDPPRLRRERHRGTCGDGTRRSGEIARRAASTPAANGGDVKRTYRSS